MISLGENVKNKKQILQEMCNNMFYSNNSYCLKKWSSFCAHKPQFKSSLTTSITGSITSSWRNTYCEGRKENITSSAIHGSVAEVGHLKCVNKPLTFFSLIAGISHHAAVTPIQKISLLISLCISLNDTLYGLLDRGKAN